MKKNTFIKLTFASIIGACIHNKYIDIKSNIVNSFISSNYSEYSSNFGCIKYRRTGNGSPILLVHNISVGDSDREWDKLIPLIQNRTIYTINLPGCGNSEKNLLQYTNFIYSKVIIDFIKNVIDDKTDIITSGNSATAAIISKMSDTDDLINKIIFINPQKPIVSTNIDSKAKLYCKALELPIIGSFIYNRAFTLDNIKDSLNKHFYITGATLDEYSSSYYNSVHYKNLNSKYMYISTKLNLINDNTEYLLKNINSYSLITSITYKENALWYNKVNPNVNIAYVNNCLDYPHIEQPQITADKIQKLLN